jgi:hypothetical protein
LEIGYQAIEMLYEARVPASEPDRGYFRKLITDMRKEKDTVEVEAWCNLA